MDERVRLASDAEAVLYRHYAAPASAYEFSVFVAAGGRPRDLAPHRPEVCYASAGWLRERVESATLEGADGKIPVRILEFSQSGMPPKQTMVLNYYLVDGSAFADIDGLRLRLVRSGKPVRCWAQVQIAAVLQPGYSADGLRTALIHFAMLAAPHVQQATERGPIMPIVEAQEQQLP